MGYRSFLPAIVLHFLAVSSAFSQSWQTTTPLPYWYYWGKSVSTSTFIYKLGGLGEKGICGSRDVFYTSINADGTIGAWVETTPLPALTPLTLTATCAGIEYQMPELSNGWAYDAVLAQNRIYMIGGVIRNNLNGMTVSGSSHVFHAPINPDGSLGAWQKTENLPAYGFGSAAAYWNGYLYVTGGRQNFPQMETTTATYFTRVNPDGSVDPWQVASTYFPIGVHLHEMAAVNGHLYISGGVTTESEHTNGVYRAPINSDGTIGEWEMEPPLPQPIVSHALVERNGILYNFGGSGPFPTAALHTAAIQPDGSLAPWTEGPPLPTTRYFHMASVGRDTVFSMGGITSANHRDVYALPDATPPAAVVDLAGVGQGASKIRLDWTATGNDGAFGAVEDGMHDIRYALNPADFSSFDTIPGQLLVPADYDPGEAESALLEGLNPGTNYYIGMKTRDRAGNLSQLSNVVQLNTFYVATSTETPPRVTLETPIPGFSVTAVPPADSAVALQNAPGTLVSSVYELSPSGTPLTPSGILTFTYDSSIDATGLAIYKYIDSTTGWSTAPITSQVIDAANFTISGRLASTSMYALFIPKKPSNDVVFSADIHPRTINLKSHGRYVTVYFEAASPNSSVETIEPDSVKIVTVNGNLVAPPIPPASKGRSRHDFGWLRGIRGLDIELLMRLLARGEKLPGHLASLFKKRGSIGDGNSNGITDLKLQYDRRKVSKHLSPGTATITFTGKLKNGKSFSSTGMVRVIEPGARKRPDLRVQFWPLTGELKWLLSLSSATPSAYCTLWPDKKRVAKGRFAVDIPSLETAVPVEQVTVSTGSDSQHVDYSARKDAAEKHELKAASDPVDFGPDGTRFDKAVSIVLPYDRSRLPAGFSEDDLAVYYWNRRVLAWQKIPSTIDRLSQVVRGLTDHFSLYQVFAGSTTAAEVSDFGEVYAFPNPARGGVHPTFHVEAPGADTVSVRVYDLTGARRHEKTLTGTSPFESVWDVSGIGSGVFYYVIEASGGGQTRRKSGKLAVIK